LSTNELNNVNHTVSWQKSIKNSQHNTVAEALRQVSGSSELSPQLSTPSQTNSFWMHWSLVLHLKKPPLQALWSVGQHILIAYISQQNNVNNNAVTELGNSFVQRLVNLLEICLVFWATRCWLFFILCPHSRLKD
jgi:hypothetical protein